MMPKALIFDQNPAIQALANHCVKQLGMEPIARAGDLLELIAELSPALVIAQVDVVLAHVEEFRQLREQRFLLISSKKVQLSLPHAQLILKPFKSEQLQEKLQELLQRDIQVEPPQMVALKIADDFTKELLILALRARAVTVDQITPDHFVSAQFLITDEKATDRLSWYEPDMGEVIEVDPQDGDLANTVFARLKVLLQPLQEPTSPLSAQERNVLTKALLKEIELTLGRTHSFRNRKWDEVRDQLSQTITSFFKG